MQQRTLDEASQRAMKAHYPEWFRLRAQAGGGLFDVGPEERSALSVSPEERRAVFDRRRRTSSLLRDGLAIRDYDD